LIREIRGFNYSAKKIVRFLAGMDIYRWMQAKDDMALLREVK
jgi:hypothetical protein